MTFKNPLGRLHLSIGKRVCGGFAVVLTLAGVLAIVSAQNVRMMQRETARSGASAGAALAAEEFVERVTGLNYWTTRSALTGTADDLAAARQQLAGTAEALRSSTATAAPAFVPPSSSSPPGRPPPSRPSRGG